MKENLSRVLVKQRIKEEIEDAVVAKDEENKDFEYENLFENMETITEETSSKRRASLKTPTKKKKKITK